MVTIYPEAPGGSSSFEWLSGKMHALEGKVSKIPSRLEMLEQRADLLEKIFLFVDIDVLNKAVAASTCHQCGPPCLVPACQVPSQSGFGASLMNKACGLVHRGRTLLGSPLGSPLGSTTALELQSPEPTGQLAGVTNVVAPMAPGMSIFGSAVDESHWSPAWPTPMASSRSTSSSLVEVPAIPGMQKLSNEQPDLRIEPVVLDSKADNWMEPSSSWCAPVPSPRSESTSPPKHLARPVCDGDSLTSLVAAADSGRVDIVSQLLDENADPDARSAEGETALHRAAYWAQKDIVGVLLEARADPSARDRKGKTPIRKSYDNPDIVAALLAARADPNAVDESGRTTLHRSAENGHVDVIEVLVRAGADPNIGNTEEETPMHEAANFGQGAALQALLRARGNINAQDAYGATLLHFAAYGGHASIAKILVEAKADVLTPNKDGESPLKSAEHGTKSEVADILRAVRARAG